MTRVIADHASADRAGQRAVETFPSVRGYTVFQYKQVGTGLTLFGAALKWADGTETEVRLAS